MSGIIRLKQPDVFPSDQERYNALYQKFYLDIDTRTLVIVENYDLYLNSGKLVLTKEEKSILATPLPLNTKDWSSR